MRQQTVLVVEDNEVLRRAFRAALTVGGFAVDEAADGIDALRRIDCSPPDLVVLDLGLPNVSGHGVLYDLTTQPHTREIPVVVVTGSPEAFEDIDVTRILRKPFTTATLVKTVQECLAPAG